MIVFNSKKWDTSQLESVKAKKLFKGKGKDWNDWPVEVCMGEKVAGLIKKG